MAGAKLRITAPPASADDALPRCFPLRISRHVPRARALQHAALANGSISSDDTVRSATTLSVRCACSTRVSIQNQHRAGGASNSGGSSKDPAGLHCPTSLTSRRVLGDRMPEALVSQRVTGGPHLVRRHGDRGARARTPKPPQPGTPKCKRGLPRKNKETAERAAPCAAPAGCVTLPQLEDLPPVCDVGAKRNAKGHQDSWIGYKL